MFSIIQHQLELKIYRQRRKHRKRRCQDSSTHEFRYKSRLKLTAPLFITQFYRKGYLDNAFVLKKVRVPTDFSFESNFDECVVFFKSVLSSFIYGKGHITIDFSRCKHTSIACFTLLDIILKECKLWEAIYNYGMKNQTKKEFKVIHSQADLRTNKYLHAFDFKEILPEDRDGSRYLLLELHKGKQKSYKYNMKAATCSRVVSFVNDSLSPSECEFNQRGRNQMEGLISEVLNNAEDHSLDNSEWYVNGISFHEIQHNTDVVELNLAIINIGDSMYEGFEGTKEKNKENYDLVEKRYKKHQKLFTLFNRFDREPLFMLYMLNEGISRLKYKDKSRGHGTMHFIEAFMALGSFGKDNRDFMPRLNIISGHSVLSCDTDYEPFMEGQVKVISLNKEKTLDLLPDRKNLKSFDAYFPGTILECKIYLNKEHLHNILNGNSKKTDRA